MKVKEANKIVEEQLEKLAEALKEGKSEAMKKYLSVMSRFHHYSLRNQILIISQREDASFVAGFKSWKKLGRWVKKGQKGIVIIAPLPFTRELGSDCEEPEITFRARYVFDVSQTEGDEMPEPPRVAGEPGEQLEKLKTFAESKKISLEYADDLGGAEGVSKGGAIVIRAGLKKAAEFAVLAHEIAHELLHHREGALKDSKQVLETEAESVAFVVSEAIGLECGTACSDYIKLYRGDTETLAQSLARIQKASAEILDSLLN